MRKIYILPVVILLCVYCGMKFSAPRLVERADDPLRRQLWSFAGGQAGGPGGSVGPEFSPVRGKCLGNGKVDNFLRKRAVDANEMLPAECLSSRDGAGAYMDEAANGFLYASGSLQAGDCPRETVARAYRKSDGEYLFLVHEYRPCMAGENFRASEPLESVLPAALSPEAFLKEGAVAGDAEFSQFIVRVELPRTGNEITARLLPLPLGMRQGAVNGLRFATDCWGEDCEEATGAAANDVFYMKELAARAGTGALDPKTPGGAAGGGSKIIAAFLAARNLDGAAFKRDWGYLYSIYAAYSKIGPRAVVMEWVPGENRFRITGKSEEVPPLSFTDFLLAMEY